jgi:hypothetical protein
MKTTKILCGSLAVALLASGCVQQPAGPMVAVMPAPYKPFEVFQQDQSVCMGYANQMVAGGAQYANNDAFGTAALGTLLGAGLGAAIGAASGAAGIGAAIGAASGAVVGTSAASGPAYGSQYGLQQRYDWAYSQCMYAKGNQVPGFQPPSAPPPPPPPSS